MAAGTGEGRAQKEQPKAKRGRKAAPLPIETAKAEGKAQRGLTQAINDSNNSNNINTATINNDINNISNNGKG